jgi:hypothetical protein
VYGGEVFPSHFEFNREYRSSMSAKSHPAMRNVDYPDPAHALRSPSTAKGRRVTADPQRLPGISSLNWLERNTHARIILRSVREDISCSLIRTLPLRLVTSIAPFPGFSSM